MKIENWIKWLKENNFKFEKGIDHKIIDVGYAADIYDVDILKISGSLGHKAKIDFDYDYIRFCKLKEKTQSFISFDELSGHIMNDEEIKEKLLKMRNWYI